MRCDARSAAHGLAPLANALLGRPLRTSTKTWVRGACLPARRLRQKGSPNPCACCPFGGARLKLRAWPGKSSIRPEHAVYVRMLRRSVAKCRSTFRGTPKHCWQRPSLTITCKSLCTVEPEKVYRGFSEPSRRLATLCSVEGGRRSRSALAALTDRAASRLAHTLSKYVSPSVRTKCGSRPYSICRTTPDGVVMLWHD